MEQAEIFPSEKGHIGTDESGKGDYFGPLVIAGFFLPEGQEEVLRELGVKDCKRLSDNRVMELARLLKKGYLYSIVTIGPERYNLLYSRLKNLNRLLAWGHARAIENILEKVNCREALTDQFGDERWVKEALLKKGKKINLIQKTGAEEDLAVAAASILARAEFLVRLEALSLETGLKLPKGASNLVEEAGVKLVKRDGTKILVRVAKLHFKTTDKIMKTAGMPDENWPPG
ncbi:MAG: ribonuclease HIII [Candidatus Saccharicenans sp.]|nr:MAG: ribonuclease HIII [Candidatus Aminicenantes bacterium]HEK85230.1 ribonuclease HIII [Candidatus Aminicenantes bacterium]